MLPELNAVPPLDSKHPTVPARPLQWTPRDIETGAPEMDVSVIKSPARIFRSGLKNVSRCPAMPTLPGAPGSAVPGICPMPNRRSLSSSPSITTSSTFSLGISNRPSGIPSATGCGATPAAPASLARGHARFLEMPRCSPLVKMRTEKNKSGIPQCRRTENEKYNLQLSEILAQALGRFSHWLSLADAPMEPFEEPLEEP